MTVSDFCKNGMVVYRRASVFGVSVLLVMIRLIACEEFSCEMYDSTAQLYDVENMCYWYVSGSFTQVTAGEQCSNKGGHLAVPDTDKIDQFVENDVFSSDCRESWLGITNKNHVDVWATWDGTRVTWTKWVAGMPLQADVDRCVKYGVRCLWKNFACDLPAGALCEAPAHPIINSTTSNDGSSEAQQMTTTSSPSTTNMSIVTKQAGRGGLSMSVSTTEVVTRPTEIVTVPCPSTKVVPCESWYHRYAECEISQAESITSATVETQHSGSVDCTFNETFGIIDNKLWVSDGCRADFIACYNNKVPPMTTQPTDEQQMVTDLSVNNTNISGTTEQGERGDLQDSTTNTGPQGKNENQTETLAKSATDISTLSTATEQTVKMSIKNKDIRRYVPPIVCVRQRLQCRKKPATCEQISLDKIKIEKKKMRKYLQKFHSAPDQRRSAKVLGLLGVGVIVTVILCLVCLDLVGFIERKQRTKPRTSKPLGLRRMGNKVEPAQKVK